MANCKLENFGGRLSYLVAWLDYTEVSRGQFLNYKHVGNLFYFRAVTARAVRASALPYTATLF